MALDIPFVPQATSFKLYTPSSTTYVPWEYTTFYLDTDSTVSFVDKDNNTTTLVALKAGYHPILVKQITAVTAGSVFVMRHSYLSQ